MFKLSSSYQKLATEGTWTLALYFMIVMLHLRYTKYLCWSLKRNDTNIATLWWLQKHDGLVKLSSHIEKVSRLKCDNLLQ